MIFSPSPIFEKMQKKNDFCERWSLFWADRIGKEMTWKLEKPVCPTGENKEKHTQKKR